jgi:hypothetical protein
VADFEQLPFDIREWKSPLRAQVEYLPADGREFRRVSVELFSSDGRVAVRSIFACSPKRNCESFQIKNKDTRDANVRFAAMQNSILNARWEGPIP